MYIYIYIYIIFIFPTISTFAFSAYQAHWSSYFPSVAFHAPLFRFRCSSFSASHCPLYLSNPFGFARSALFSSCASRVSGSTSLLFSSRFFSSRLSCSSIFLQPSSSSKAKRTVRRRQRKKALASSSSPSLLSKNMETKELHCSFFLDKNQSSSEEPQLSASCRTDVSHPPQHYRSKRNTYYCVAQGREVGIYMSWESCSAQVMGFKGAVYKKFPSLEEARAFLKANRTTPSGSNEEGEKTTISRLHCPHSTPIAMPTGSATVSLREGSSTSLGTETKSAIPHTSTLSFTTTAPRGMPELDFPGRKRQRSSSPIAPSSLGTSSSTSVRPLRSSAVPHRPPPCPPSRWGGEESNDGKGSSDFPEIPSTVERRGIRRGESGKEEGSGVQVAPPSEVPSFSSDDAVLFSSGMVNPSVIYVDGACSHNGKGGGKAKGGYGVFYGPGDKRNVAKALPSHELQTNNRAELYAAIYAIQAALNAQQQEEERLIKMVAETLSLCEFFKEANELSQYGDQLRNNREAKVRSDQEDMVEDGSSPSVLPLPFPFPPGSSPFSSISPSHTVHLLAWWELKKRLHYFLQLLYQNGARLSQCSPCLLAQLHIHTDSKYVMEGLLSYCKTWEKKGFRRTGSNKPVLNVDLWRQLVSLRDVYNTLYYAQRWVLHHYPLEKTGGDPVFRCGPPNVRDTNTPTAATCNSAVPLPLDGSHSPFFSIPVPKVYTPSTTKNTENEGVLIFHVKGHSNFYGNVQADKLAVMGAQMRDEN